MPGVTHDDAPPLLADLLPWSVAPLRLGRAWPMAPDAASLKARWAAFVRAEGPAREVLLGPTRARAPSGRPGRVRPLYRRPGGLEPNLAPGLVDHLTARLGLRPDPVDVLAWALATARPDPKGCRVPLTADPSLWTRGSELGHRML